MDFEQRPVFWIEKMESFLVYTLVSNVNYEREEAKRHRDSHEDMLDDCICGFGVMLYLALKSHYFVSRNVDDREDAVFQKFTGRFLRHLMRTLFSSVHGLIVQLRSLIRTIGSLTGVGMEGTWTRRQ